MMKQTAFFVLSLILAAGPGYGQTSAGPAVNTAAAGQIGIVAAVRGVVEIQKTGQVGKVVGSGAPIYLGDEIRTDEGSTLQILLLDETIFTVGPSSRITIDEFVYDPKSGEGAVSAQVAEGVFRFVTGKIARKKPEKMQVAVPHGSIGVRGTIFGLETRGGQSLGVLLGPGARHNTPHRDGSLSMKAGGKETRIDQTGFGAELGPGGALSGSFRVPEDVIERMTSALSVTPAEGAQQQGGGGAGGDSEGGTDGGEGESATEASGQATAGAAGSLGDVAVAAGAAQALDAEASEASRDAASQARVIVDGVSQLEDLRTIETGQFHFSQTDIPFSGGSAGDDYFIEYDIDFGARTVGSPLSRLQGELPADVSGGVVASFPLEARSFASGTGEAIFKYDGVVPDTDPNPCTPGCTANIVINLNNSGGIPAATMSHTVTITDGTDTTTGSGTGAPRVEGALTI